MLETVLMGMRYGQTWKSGLIMYSRGVALSSKLWKSRIERSGLNWDRKSRRVL